MITSILTGTGLAMDAFAISVTNGLTVKEFRTRHAILMGLYFGTFQFLMPLMGCLLGCTVSGYINAFGPYISFCLLAFIGSKMIWEALHHSDDECSAGVQIKQGRLLALAVATSIDALAVGVSFAFSPPTIGILASCIVIGAVTFIISAAGGVAGKHIPNISGKKAEVFGGTILIGIGIKLLIEGVFL